MSICQRCGASIGTADIACRYCGAPNPDGIALRRVEQARFESQAVARANQEHYARTQADATMRRHSRQAFYWSVSALPLCCLPVPGVIATVLALRARKLAREHRLALPGQAVAALALSALAFVMCVAMYTFVVLDSRALALRRKELHAAVEPAAAAASITQATACALVELWLLENRFEDRDWTTSDHIDCPGKLERHGERAQLFDIRLHRSSSPAFVATGCLKHGARWMVQGVRRGDSCDPEGPSSPNVAQQGDGGVLSH